MNTLSYSLVIPAHNEELYIVHTLQSIVNQTVLPTKVVVVDDHSTDGTAQLVKNFVEKYSFIELLQIQSGIEHLPGSKVIQAFNKGLPLLQNNFDIIVKLDADLILPTNYFETIIQHFLVDKTVGMAGGFAYIEKNSEWILENLTDKTHIRGAFKAYRKACFDQIGGLQPEMGWDTADELLARFYGWKIVTNENLHIKHLKPTGANYNQAARYKQGEAFYSLGYGCVLTSIAGLKLAFKKDKPLLFIDYLKGYWKAKQNHKLKLVTPEQEKFIRSYRWKKIKEKFF
jgi:glycosyltransferase involved in cell wall biosynthesis